MLAAPKLRDAAMPKSMHWQHGIYLKLAMKVTWLVEKKVTEIHGKQHEVRGR